MRIYLYTFSKKHNSTAIPSIEGVAVDVLLKESTSIWEPQFLLSSATIPEYNYLSWDDRFYFIDDIVKANRDTYSISCSVDPLATWRSEILSMNTFVERSASTYNSYLNDNEMSVNQEIGSMSYSSTTLTDSTGVKNLFNGAGCYIVRCTSDDSDSITGISTYVMTKTELASLLSFLFNDSGSIWEAAWDSVTKAVFNPFQYVLSIKWCAINYSIMSAGLTSKEVHLGWWTTGLQAKVVDYVGQTFSYSLVMGDVINNYGDFRDTNPNYTKYKILIPGSGLFELPSILMSLLLDIQLYMDVVTGKSTWFLLYNASNQVLARFEGNVCADIQISQVNRDLANTIGYTAGAVGMALSGNAIGATMGGVNAIGNILQGVPSTNGNASSLMELASINAVVLYAERYRSKDNYSPITRGKPLMENKTLSTLSGFCQCGQASIDCDAPPKYKDLINSYINSGFYIE